jgi:hypothetical protein
MKKFLLLALFLIGITAFSAEAQLIKPRADKKLNVAPTWYVTDVNGFQLIFADRQGRIENLQDMKLKDTTYNPDIVVIKDDKFGDWRVAETLEESHVQDTTLSPGSNMAVIRRKLTDIIEYKRTGRY